MNVVIMQPFYYFLRKHFHLIYLSDIYVFYDDVQYVKCYHHNRNKIKTHKGGIYLTVPVLTKNHFPQIMTDVMINNRCDWRRKHWRSIQLNYQKTPYFKQYQDFFHECYSRKWENLCDLNIYLIKHICGFLGIKGKTFIRSSELGIYHQNKSQRPIEICEHLGGKKFIIGTRAKDYMDESLWEKSEVELCYFEPKYPQYPQLHGEYLDNCAIIDLLFNCGQDSYRYIWGDRGAVN